MLILVFIRDLYKYVLCALVILGGAHCEHLVDEKSIQSTYLLSKNVITGPGRNMETLALLLMEVLAMINSNGLTEILR